MSKEDYSIRDWQKMNCDSARFVLEQAEMNLQEKINVADALIQRALTILTISLPSLVVVASYVLTTKDRGLVLHLAMIALILIVIILLKCLKAYSLYDYKPLGNSPRNIIREDNIGDELKVFLIERIEAVQKAIDFNKVKNDERIEAIRLIFKTIKTGLIILIAYSIFLYPLLFLLFRTQLQFGCPCP